ncbi:hypothetical protein ACFYZB_35095 [Streptomyces sp. NPDC001852]|uniref:hypothetical protein n=1 Tax=Streptomyces sp. NPDC001852 TaxID=3364619 RepID=UPI0036960DE6
MIPDQVVCEQSPPVTGQVATVLPERRTRLLHVVAVDEEVVFVQYEYEVAGGGRYRTMEAITVREGLVRAVRVFFGGTV